MGKMLDHRNFILNMSVTDGQELAAKIGYGTPDDQGVFLERMAVLRRWAALNASGVLDIAKESASWMTHLICQPDWEIDHMSATYSAFVSLMAATLMRLQEEGLIMLAYSPTIVLAEYDPDTETTIPIDYLEYSYKEDIGHMDFDPDYEDDEDDDYEQF